MDHQPFRVQAAGHDWSLFVTTDAYIAALLDDIRAARQRIWVEVYIFEPDRVGKAVSHALQERARAGVQVRLLYDAIGSQAASAGFFLALERAGVQVHAFHSIWDALWRFAPLKVLNRRNHRKLIVIDDRAVWFGGMNLVDPAKHARSSLAADASWRDLQVRLSGPQLADAADSFDRSWRRAHRQRVPARPTRYRQGLLPEGGESMQFFDTGSGKRFTTVGRVVGRLLAAANQRIDIAMAYFLPVGRVSRELLAARRRGVRIRLAVPGKSDVPIVRHATRYLYRGLLRRRMAIYERQTSMLHTKALVIDEEWTVLGSANLDPRSLLLNYEFIAVVRSAALAQVVRQIIEHELAHSRRVTIRHYRRLPCEQRLIDRLAWAVRWWL